MNEIEHYWKKKLVVKNLEVEYSSEKNEIAIKFDHTIANGKFITSDYLRIHPSYVEALCELLQKITIDEPAAAQKEVE